MKVGVDHQKAGVMGIMRGKEGGWSSGGKNARAHWVSDDTSG